MNPLHNNHNNNNVHEFNITGGSNFPQTTATNATQAGRFSNNNRYVPSCNCNNDISVLNNDTSPTRHYQQKISCDASNDKVGHQTTPNNVSSPHFYPQYNDQNSSNALNSLGITINSPHTTIIITSDQNSSNAFPLLNSLGITINSPRATIIITSSDIRNLIQQDHAYSNKSP
ncbi:hypothetical protein GLOIN_2v1761167 [Rhizophagus irregularis DAOM 181602=DAOM 197198]|uniref:Uncharacterized protein n=1 Tax=Rhizophagus irregularis (strain DAOM 181602 / DAOM 197198 / MUCL 43194) TaxID=747089 RepID=A0A2P4QZS1_RHIID|nr:hypothetical protein GLOIN_2v1761167 [Rhizophagus irregularis DAOM 181602=DAOM 197198]POG83153.1 hypothetical protein GLOIN_2v1761167 [Rhizophagus irregularis DAOM 181602=DAOM 197198]GBC44092.2 hypothetical protein GLOIN_2v1761167 [Rhizophagus irregularis DAOM 181602=DAOM 197198]|eukprot:XP_025190019.1 hypothetical protein GLOIN_2v1761167 [Rhizophagus irregularis DAOM 181602=DAOM 197198]